jgi:hypothetical protein
VQGSQKLIGELENCSSVVVELLLLEAGTCDTGIVREPRGRGTSAVRSHYQGTTGEDTEE